MSGIANATLPEGLDREVLARRLFWKMELLDPTDSGDWGSLTDYEKDFYRLCVADLLLGVEASARASCSGLRDPTTA